MSRAIATSILRKFSACRSSRLAKAILPSLVTPSTSSAISPPNRSTSGLAGRGVLDDVVEEPGRDGGGVHLELGEEAGDLERVDVVGLAGDPALAPVDLRGELVGAPDDVDIPARLVAGNLGQEVAQRPHVRVPARPRGTGRGATRPGPAGGPTAAG